MQPSAIILKGHSCRQRGRVANSQFEVVAQHGSLCDPTCGQRSSVCSGYELMVQLCAHRSAVSVFVQVATPTHQESGCRTLCSEFCGWIAGFPRRSPDVISRQGGGQGVAPIWRDGGDAGGRAVIVLHMLHEPRPCHCGRGCEVRGLVAAGGQNVTTKPDSAHTAGGVNT